MAKPIITLKPEPTGHISLSVRKSIKVRYQHFIQFCHEHRVDVVAVMSDNLPDFFDDVEGRINDHLTKTQNSAQVNGHVLTER